MSIQFSPITLEDRERVQEIVFNSPYMNCDLSFANLYNWQEYYSTEIAFHKGMMIVRFLTEERTRPAYLMPLGDGDIRGAFEDMACDCCTGGLPMMLMSITEPSMDTLEEIYPNQYHIIQNRDYYDYIYLREKLCTLSGKKLQSKRNHINRFERDYPDYTFETLSDDNVRECMALENEWYKSSDISEAIVAERKIIKRSLQNYKEIGLTGGAIRVHGEIVAFTMGMPINNDTFGVCIEKAHPDMPEAYPIINREYARTIPEKYTYVNREEDLGIEGLRKAKLSYKPEILLEKNVVLIHTDEMQ